MLGSASAQWAVTAPIFVPMLMLIGYSPEVIQAAYQWANDADLLFAVVTEARVEIAALIEEMKEALVKPDCKTAQRCAHTIKGIATSLGAESTRQLAASMESSLNAGEAGIAETNLDELVSSVDSMLSACDDYFNRTTRTAE